MKISDLKWNGSPFVPMEWQYNHFGKPYPKLVNGFPGCVSFNEYENESGRKLYIVEGNFPDNNRTSFRFKRWDKFIQPNEIENEYLTFRQKREG